MKSSTHTYTYLVGGCIESFGEQLPTGLQVVQLYCYEWYARKSNPEKIRRVVNQIMSVWNRAHIPVRSVRSIYLKVEKLIMRFKNILNTRTRSTNVQVEKENSFLADCSKLFDVVHEESVVSLSMDSIIFLNDQRNERLQEISNIDPSDTTSEDHGRNRIDVVSFLLEV